MGAQNNTYEPCYPTLTIGYETNLMAGIYNPYSFTFSELKSTVHHSIDSEVGLRLVDVCTG